MKAIQIEKPEVLKIIDMDKKVNESGYYTPIISEENKNISLEVKGNETILKMTTTYGMPVEVVLKKIK